MQLESFKYLIELEKAGSFYRAAKNTFISQQGLNKAVSSLESELGVKLIERSRKSVRFTRVGEVALAYAHRIVDEHDAMLIALGEQERDSDSADNPVHLHVSYYSAQIAAANPRYVALLADHFTYMEDSYDKLIHHALASDGSDLSFLDVHAHSLPEILSHPDLHFEPIITTRVGVVFREDDPLAHEQFLHRSAVAKLPVAIDEFREIAQLVERLFHDDPLKNIRLGVTSPRMLLQYVQSAERGVAIFDSFGFFLAQKDPAMPTEGLRFSPLATPEAICQVGFLYPRNVKLTIRARHAVSALRRFLADNCPDYFKRYPTAI